MDSEQESKLRSYAAGDLAWKQLHDDGMTYSQVLDGLGELGLRPPTVRPGGPNQAALQRGTDLMRKLLARQARP